MPTNLITATRRLLRAAVNAHGQTVKQWAALLAVICGLTFNAQAANKRVTATGTTFDSDATYDSAWSNVIIYVGGAAGGVVYSGTNITTISASTWIGMAIVNSGTVELSTGTLDNRNSPNFALSVVHNSYFSGTNVTLLGNGVVVDVGRGQPFGSQLHLTDSRIESFGANSLGALSLYYENSKAYLDHVTIITESGRGIYSYGSGGVTGNRVIINSGGWGIQMDTPSIYTAYDLTDSVINAKDAAIVSYSSNGNLGTISIHGGSVTATEGVLVSVSGTNHNLTVNFTDGAVLAGQGLLDNHEINGNVVINLDQVDSGSAGGITVSDTNAARTEVNVNGGTGINGDVTNSGSGALTVNLDHSSLTGDAANLGDGVLVITLDNHSTGSGGYNGGNLITGGDSAWTFNKNSHGHYGENNGVWNIGDYDVIFDNLTHSGTLNISVNNDTGEGGSIVVTGTADGDGTVHIDTTGDGKLNPNDVLPGIVSGDGTEHWQWDPIDWGIDTIVKDGDHFVKKGTSPAGAVLNSSVAIQQAMWFAQQNSLLKRMGELRYGTRASRPPAGGTPAFHNLIENLWLRSYGQQLNIGSQVAGKAYEQLIYGVDLGTDHKFTISADSDLYLGVYAGYGRSDLDYRTPGTDGELNSYYGGLYATWLHASGFYLDATVKAASVDNDLKAPYDSTQLKANYSDINLGGSLELGKKFTFADAWFIEPQFQVNYLHILAENYTAGPLTISAQDLDALQLRIGSVFGRTINLTNSGALQPYIKISGVETISSGGAIRNGYQHIRANTDGARAELGGGLIWQLDTNNQLHLDYEASFGDKYDKPWGLTAGYRHQF